MARLQPAGARRAVWVNPHRGRPGYAGRCRAAMRRPCPHVWTHFVAGHTAWRRSHERRCEVVAHVRDVLERAARAGGGAGRPSGWAPSVGTWRSAAPASRARRCSSARTARRSAACPAAASRARSTSWPRTVVDTGAADAAALRRQRRRRVRRRPDLRRHPRRVRRADDPRDVPGARRDRRDVEPARAGRRRHRGQGPDRPAGPAAGALAGPRRRARSARRGWTTRSPTTPAGCSPPAATATLHYGPDGERRGDDLTRVRLLLRPAGRG